MSPVGHLSVLVPPVGQWPMVMSNYLCERLCNITINKSKSKHLKGHLAPRVGHVPVLHRGRAGPSGIFKCPDSRNSRNAKIPWIRKVSGNGRNVKIPWGRGQSSLRLKNSQNQKRAAINVWTLPFVCFVLYICTCIKRWDTNRFWVLSGWRPPGTNRLLKLLTQCWPNFDPF